MSVREQALSILAGLADVLAPVGPVRAALWFGTVLAGAILLVYGWQRLLRH